MNKDQAGIILNSMIEFIEQSGKERCEEIQRQAKQDFAVGKEQAIENEKKRLKDNFENKLVNAEVQLKIKKSAQQNKARIDRMRAINELVEKLLVETKKSMAAKFNENPEEYKDLLEQLLIQGLIKLHETKVALRCRKSDVGVLKSVIEGAVATYKNLMLTKVKKLENMTEMKC